MPGITTIHAPPALGLGVPPFTPHAISVSLPTWKDNVDYEEGDPRVSNAMVCGYPRFFIHPTIQKLIALCKQKFGSEEESCLLFPSHKIASKCQEFIERRSSAQFTARLTHLPVFEPKSPKEESSTPPPVDIHVVLFPSPAFGIAKQFWQHAGFGISSRVAEYCLSLLEDQASTSKPQSPTQSPTISPVRFPLKPSNRHYSVKTPVPQNNSSTSFQTTETASDQIDSDHNTYLEERYGRNLPREQATRAKRALRRRIAGVIVGDVEASPRPDSDSDDKDLSPGASARGGNVTEADVFLFPSGMAAIWSAHKLALSTRPQAKSVCFGFPYTDTLKILEKWGPGCYHLGNGLDEDIDELENILEQESAKDPSKPPILALFTEFPSNPLLRSANLPRLRTLADKYDFLIVVDETIGNYTNVRVQKYSDIIVSSLTKVFSGYSNVMGGSLILNPTSRHYQALKSWMEGNYEDVYFDQDAIFMERNSRNFKPRSRLINTNTEAVCDLLRSQSLAGGNTSSSTVIKEVYYPKYITSSNYEICRIKVKEGDGAEGGYGGLFSLTFTSQSASEAFFDALPCYKGPSLGTNFTLASPYTILAHYTELDWAAKWGVEKGLVRVSVGTEDKEVLLEWFKTSLKAAQDAIAS
ncbi:hypothetical protein ONZ45_g11910 [Pleurotus djamor]|nr:hypothetical protein ONZ45_g11910 [Pleurotus djamor]